MFNLPTVEMDGTLITAILLAVDESAKEIYGLLSDDSFIRFVKTKQYKKLQ